jgi:hypothetical protein
MKFNWFWEKEKLTINELKKNFKNSYFMFIISIMATLVLSILSIFVFEFIGLTVLYGIITICTLIILEQEKQALKTRLRL